MTVRKPCLAILLSLAFIPALASSARAQTPDEIIEKHLAAVGGRAALEKLTSRRSTGTVTISTPSGDITGPVELSAKAPNKARVAMQLDLTALGMTDKLMVERKFDGTAGWSLNSMQGDSEITGNELDNMRSNVFPTPLLTYKASGFRVDVLPKEKIGGKDVFVLLATPKAGSATRLYFDAGTYLLVRTLATINSAQMGGDIEQSADFSDYRVVDGVKVPFQIVNANAAQSATIKLTKVEHNVPLADSLFAKAPTPPGDRK